MRYYKRAPKGGVSRAVFMECKDAHYYRKFTKDGFSSEIFYETGSCMAKMHQGSCKELGYQEIPKEEFDQFMQSRKTK